jgi:hypothetical protein
MSPSKQELQVVRASGLPIDLVDIVKYEEEFKQIYDKVLLKLKVDEKIMLSRNTAERMNRLLDRCQKILLKKYPKEAYWPLPKSPRAWLKITATLGPIAIAKHAHNGNLVLIIMDADFSTSPQQ